MQRFLDADVCAVEHLRPTEVFDTPQARHNGMVVTVDDPVLGPVEQVAPAIKFSATPGAVRGPAPSVGEHTDDVLADRGRLAGAGVPGVARRRPTPARCSPACASSTSARTTRGRTRRACSPTSAPTS